MNEIKPKKSRFIPTFKPELIETELDDIVRKDDIILSVAFITICSLFIWLYSAHQTSSSGFFTEKFGIFEMILLYGSLIYWIITCTFLLLRLKNPSRNLDSFGGLIFATLGFIWLFIVFPFDFDHFADVLPDGIKFLVNWISDIVARVILALGFVSHLFLANYAGRLRVVVLKERARRKLLGQNTSTTVENDP
jgi:hypothetical protein